jgi:propionate CoA-transferase
MPTGRAVTWPTHWARHRPIGGVPAGGLDFAASVNSQAVIDQPYQFDFYDGGGLDFAFLRLAQADTAGDVNVSKFGPSLPERAVGSPSVRLGHSSTSVRTPKRSCSSGRFEAGGPRPVIEHGRLILRGLGDSSYSFGTSSIGTFSSG